MSSPQPEQPETTQPQGGFTLPADLVVGEFRRIAGETIADLLYKQALASATNKQATEIIRAMGAHIEHIEKPAGEPAKD